MLFCYLLLPLPPALLLWGDKYSYSWRVTYFRKPAQQVNKRKHLPSQISSLSLSTPQPPKHLHWSNEGRSTMAIQQPGKERNCSNGQRRYKHVWNYIWLTAVNSILKEAPLLSHTAQSLEMVSSTPKSNCRLKGAVPFSLLPCRHIWPGAHLNFLQHQSNQLVEMLENEFNIDRKGIASRVTVGMPG